MNLSLRLTSQFWLYQTYQHVVITNVAIPILFFAIHFFNALIHYCCQQLFKTNPISQFSWNSYVRTLVYLFLFSYSQVTSTVLQYLNCVEVQVQGMVIYTQPSISCEDEKYKKWLGFVLFMLVVGVLGIPLMILIFLYRNRYNISNNSNFCNRYELLFAPYKRKYFWWNCWILARRSLFAIINTFLMTKQNIMYMVISLFNVSCIIAQAWYRPYKLDADNSMEFSALIALSFLSILLTCFIPPFDNNAIRSIAFLLIFVPTILYLLFIVYQIITKHSILEKIRSLSTISDETDYADSNSGGTTSLEPIKNSHQNASQSINVNEASSIELYLINPLQENSSS